MKITYSGAIPLLGLLLLLLLGGCGGTMAFKTGEDYLRQGRYDEAVAEFAMALEKAPESREYRLNLLKAKGAAATKHLEEGRRLAGTRQYEAALREFHQARALDPSLAVAAQEIERTETLNQVEQLVGEAETFYRARRFNNAKNNLTRALEISPGHPKALELLVKVQQSRNTLMDGFELDIASDTTITLTFKSAKTKEVFGILSKLSGINFIFDEEMKDQNVSLSFEKATFAQALELLLGMNDLGKKVLNSKTIIIYSNSKEKVKQYEDHIIQTFYLSNIDAKKAVNLLRTMLQLRKIYVHEELNALVIRDTPQVIKLAQQVIEAADRGDSEVVLDLELVEVTHNNELQIGPTLSTYSVGVGFSNPGSKTIVPDTLTPGSTTITDTDDTTVTGVTNNLVQSLNGLQTFYTLPTATFDLLRKLSDSEILANPSIRVKNKEKAKVHIGSREPVITVTINGDQTSENIQYVDVGVKLDVEPTIQLDNTVTTKLNLEVSNATRLAALASGTTPLVISTTNATTALVLKNGEQTIIGGLLRDDASKSKTTIPFLGEIPLIGHLFTGHGNTKTKREILLSITPHIVKNVDVPDASVASIWSGGEDDLKAGANFGSFAAFKPELEEPPMAAAPALPPAGAAPDTATDSEVPAGFVEVPADEPTAEDYAEVVDGAEVPPTAAPVGGEGALPGGPPADVAPPAGPASEPVAPAAEATSPTAVEVVMPPVAAPSVAAPVVLAPVVPTVVAPTAPAAEVVMPPVAVPSVVATAAPEPVVPVAEAPAASAAGAGVVPVAVPSVATPAAPASGPPVAAVAAAGTTAAAPSLLPKVADRARIYFTGASQVGVGQEIVLEAVVEEVKDLYSAPLFVRFDSQMLSFVRAEEADFLKAGGQATLFTTSVNHEKGELIVGYKQGLGGAGVSGGGKLFRLVFKGRAPGQAQVGFDRINFRNPAGNRLVVLPMALTLEVR